MKKFFFSLFIVFFVACATPPAEKDKKTPFPVFELPIPQNDAQKNYLGISGSGKFMITHIKSPVIIIEVFSTYCPHCQNDAPLVNQLYLAIQARPDLKEKIKIIGIGINNGTYEVDLFRARYKVSFPLFPDQDNAISQKLGVTATPTFIGAKNNHDGTTEEFYFKSGALRDVNSFLEEIIKLSKLLPPTIRKTGTNPVQGSN